ncbi:MAG: hypothetical protein QOG80_1392 [Pseudonocardiales bacterium]|nr:hypothetical protein [Pseudonocardiales bacterium]
MTASDPGATTPPLVLDVDLEHRIVGVSGELGEVTAPMLTSAGMHILSLGPGDLTLDFGGVTFISSPGLNAVVELRIALHERHEELRLLNLSAQVKRVFVAGGLAALL